MRYKSHIFHIRYRFVCLLLLFMALAARGFGQNNCSNDHPIFMSTWTPAPACAGDTITFTVGYESEDTLVIAPKEPVEESHGLFIPDPYCTDGTDEGCTHQSTIHYSGYEGNVTDTSILYVRLNLEHDNASTIYIRLRCPDSTTATILKFGDVENLDYCTNSIPNEDRGWDGVPESEVADQYTLFGDASTYSDNCFVDTPIPGGAWNYCWSNHNNYTYASSGVIYAESNVTNDIFDSSNVALGVQFYHPDEPFSVLNGCPINGDWTIEIIAGTSDGSSGFLHDWEIVFSEPHTGDNGGVEEMAVLFTPGGAVDPDFSYNSVDTSFTYITPTDITQDLTFARTLQFYNSLTHCYYDTTITFTVLAPTIYPPETLYVCEGSSIPLDAGACVPNRMMQSFGFIDQFGDEWHSWMHGHNGPGNVEVDSFPEFVEALWQFPIRTKVFPAGGKVKLGTSNRSTGSMTSLPMSLQNAFDVTVRAKGWGAEPGTGATPKKTRVNVIVDKDQISQQIQSFETSPTYYWPGDDAYQDYTLSFNGATIASTITVETVKANPATAYDTRLFLESVSATNEIEGCTYQWSFNGTLMPDSISQQISVTQAGTYTVTVDPHNGDCPWVKTFEVVVVQPPVVSISGDADICAGEVDTLRAFPKGNGYQYNWNPSSGTWIVGWSQNLSDIYINPALDKNLSVTVTDLTNGCSGTASFSVTVHEASPSLPIYLVACDSIEYHGKTYSESVAKVIPSEPNYFGCPDTLYNLDLHIFHSSDTVVYDTACAIYTWGDDTYTESGVYTKTFPVSHTHPLDNSIVAVCDSTVELHLTVYPEYHISIDTTICYWEKPFVFNGQTYNQSGHFTVIANSTTANGCDSIVTLDLTILPENRDSIFADICKGETYNSQYWGPLTPDRKSVV